MARTSTLPAWRAWPLLVLVGLAAGPAQAQNAPLWLPGVAPLRGTAMTTAAPDAAERPPARPRLPLDHAPESDSPGWLADQRNGCHVFVMRMTPGTTVDWSGGCVDGMADGPGVTEFRRPDGQVQRVEGARRFGMAYGPRTLTRRGIDNRVERIELIRLGAEGRNQGRHVYPDGARYTGTMLGMVPHGEGRMEYPSGAWYQGNWRNGEASGHGGGQRADGTPVQGPFSAGCSSDGAHYFAVERRPTTGCRRSELGWEPTASQRLHLRGGTPNFRSGTGQLLQAP